MPMSLNGNESSQTNGYAISASSASGQQKKNKSNQRRNLIMGHLHSIIRITAATVAGNA